MQFTPQQLVGAGRYAPVTRIGNWNEDLMLEEARMKEFQLRKKQGSLLATHKLKSDFLHQRAPRSFDAQQAVHWNDAVGIAHHDADGLLCCNVFEETPSVGSDEYVVTVSSSRGSAALARNTFRVVSPQDWKASQGGAAPFAYATRGEPLCYGEPFFLMCNEALLVDDKSVLMKPPLFLKSGLKTERSMSPITYNQRVWMSAEPDSSALWVCERADLAKTEKLLAAGSHVRAGDPVAIVHKMTGHPLYCDPKNKQPTDFGVELELCTFGAKTAGRYHNIGAEVIGTRTADTEARAQLPPNTWSFVLAATEREAVDERQLPDFASPAAVRYVLERCLLGASLYAFRAFAVELERIDAKQGKSGYVSFEDAKWPLKALDLPLRDEHLDLLFASFDKRSPGRFPLESLLGALREPLSAARKRAVEAAFARLAQQNSGNKLTLGALCGMYDPSIDSRVRGKQLSADAAVTEYRSLWMAQTPASEITLRDFLDVYADVSLAIANDAHFEQLLAESWKSE